MKITSSKKMISSKSKIRVLRLLRPPTDKTGVDERPPTGLTVRQLIHYKRYRALRNRATVIRVDGDHLLSVDNLTKLGYDLVDLGN